MDFSQRIIFMFSEGCSTKGMRRSLSLSDKSQNAYVTSGTQNTGKTEGACRHTFSQSVTVRHLLWVAVFVNMGRHTDAWSLIASYSEKVNCCITFVINVIFYTITFSKKVKPSLYRGGKAS